MKNIFLTALLIALLTPFSLSAQNAEPSWLNETHVEGANSYVEVFSGYGSTLDEARTKASQEIRKRRSLAAGEGVSVSMNNSDINISSSNELIVKARVLDEYVDFRGGLYRVYYLVQTLKDIRLPYESVKIKEKCSPGKAFLPGAAQYAKGYKGKAAVIWTGEALMVGGTVFGLVMDRHYLNKCRQTDDTYNYDSYYNRHKFYRNVWASSLIGAGVIYVCSMIDGLCSKGKYVSIGGVEGYLSMMPYADTQSAGLALNITF